MKGASWRFVIAMALLGFGMYYFVILKQEKPPTQPPVTTKIWSDKVDALAQMKTNMYAIIEAEKNKKTLDGTFIACAPNPAEVPATRVAWDSRDAAGWTELDVMMPDMTWFQYEVVVTGENTFEVHARTLAERTPLEFVIDQDMNFH